MNNIYYVVEYGHKYGSDVIGLFATEEEAVLYVRKQIIEPYYNDYAQDESEPIPSMLEWPEFTDGREYIAIHVVQEPGWNPKENENGQESNR